MHLIVRDTASGAFENCVQSALNAWARLGLASRGRYSQRGMYDVVQSRFTAIIRNMVEVMTNLDTYRDARGRFVGGNRVASKRLGKKYQGAYALARACTPFAVDALLEIVMDSKAKPKTRALAAKTLLNYGWGKRPVDIAGLVEAARSVREHFSVGDLVNGITRDDYARYISLLLMLNPDLPETLTVLQKQTCSVETLERLMSGR